VTQFLRAYSGEDSTSITRWPTQSPGKRGAFDRWMQHHLVNVLFKDGVYEALETIETFSHPENRDLESLEVWASSGMLSVF